MRCDAYFTHECHFVFILTRMYMITAHYTQMNNRLLNIQKQTLIMQFFVLLVDAQVIY